MLRLICALLCVVITLPSHAESITLVAEDDWAPYSSLKPDQSGPEGLAPELIKQAFRQKGIEVKYVTLPFARCMYLTLIGKQVGCFDAAITQDNKDQYYWHKTPLFVESLSLFANVKANVQEVKLKDLEGKIVSYTIGYTYPPEIFHNKKIKIFGANSDHQQLAMVAAGRVDYALIYNSPGIVIVKKDSRLRSKIKIVGHLSNDHFYIAFSKKHPDGKRLMETFEAGLTLLKSSGQYDQLMLEFNQQYSLNPSAPK